MKKLLITTLLFICCILPIQAQNCTPYKNLCFSEINTEMYKFPVITVINHKRTVNYHEGAKNYCSSLGMRLPSKDEKDILTGYLLKTGIVDGSIPSFWLKEDVSGQIGNAYVNNNGSSAYILTYNGRGGQVLSFLQPGQKTSGMFSSTYAICVKEHPPLSNEDKINLIKDDYKGYLNDGGSFYGVIEKALSEFSIGLNTTINKYYLELVKSNLDDIVTDKISNLNDTIIQIKEEDENKLNDKVKELVNTYNQIMLLEYTD